MEYITELAEFIVREMEKDKPDFRLISARANSIKKIADDVVNQVKTVSDLSNRTVESLRYVYPFTRLLDMPKNALNELRELLSEGKKVQSIRLIREHTNLLLLECKTIVDRFSQRYSGGSIEEFANAKLIKDREFLELCKKIPHFNE